MLKRMGFEWNLRRLMADQDMYQTTDLVPKLAEYGVHLSREQVFRLVTQPPQRLSMDTLVALCGILGCSCGGSDRGQGGPAAGRSADGDGRERLGPRPAGAAGAGAAA